MSEYEDLDAQMHSPEMLYRNHAIDEKIVAFSSKRRWVLPVMFAFVVVLNIGVLIQLSRQAITNHKELLANQELAKGISYTITNEVPQLNYQIERLDLQLAHARLVSDEETAVILRLAHQVIRLGGNPGQIVIK